MAGRVCDIGAVGLAWCAVCALWYRDDPGGHSSVNALNFDDHPVGAAAPPKATESGSLAGSAAQQTMLALFFSYFASGFGFQFFVTWLPTYFMREHGLSLQKSGVFAALLWRPGRSVA